ncbi:MAG: hypothetical protein GY943_17435 [Chloroflexi bacterium]|nr:hypothetical protein [Chloroflexota bacterium]
MRANIISQTTQVTVFREWQSYWHGIWKGGLPVGQEKISANRAKEIIRTYPSGSTPSGNPPNFSDDPCTWQWSVQMDA